MKHVLKCKCKGKYVIPMLKQIPQELLHLSKDDIKLLSPFDIDVGKYVMKPYGYRAKSAAFALHVKERNVQDVIEDIECTERKHRFVLLTW